MTIAMSQVGAQKSLFIVISVLLIITGSLQTLSLAIVWFLDGQMIYAISAFIVLITAGLLWTSSISQLIQSFGQNSNEDLF